MPVTRAYNSFRIDDESSKIVKVSSTSRLRDEISYYCDIEQTPLCHFFPRKFRHNIKNAPYEIELEYYDYDDLGLQMVNDRHLSARSFEALWDVTAAKLVAILDIFQHGWHHHPASEDAKRKMYIEKTCHYQQELIRDSSYFRELNKDKEIKVNGKRILNFDQIWGSVEQLIQKTLINSDPLSVIHGDMCFSNILCSKRKNIMRFIDPRGSFGEQGIHGDPCYDIAKLIHSYEGGYEYIINDRFELKMGTDIIFKFANNNLHLIQNSFKKHKTFQNPKAKLIEGLIFVGMCSRHYDSLERQIVMYLTGLNILNEIVS